MQAEHKTKFLDLPFAALAIPLLLGIYLIITSTRYLFTGNAIFDVKRMLEITVFGLVLAITIIDPGLRSEVAAQFKRIPRWIAYGLTGIIGLGIVSSVYNAASPYALAYSLADVYLLAMIIVLTLVVAACRSIAGTLFDQLAIFVLAMLGLAVGLQEMIGVTVAWSRGYQFSYDIALTHFAHPRFYNQLQSWTVPLLAALPVVFSRYRPATLLCVLILGLQWYILLMTGARGSTLSLLAAFSVSLLLLPPARRLIIKWQSAGLLLGALIYISMFLGPATGFAPAGAPTILQPPATDDVAATEQPAAANPYLELSLGRPMLHSSGRITLWSAALDYAKESPLLGIGPMNYACNGTFGRVGHPHNFALQLLSEWGLPAMLLALGILLAVLKLLVSRLRAPSGLCHPDQRQLQAVLATSVLAAILHSGLSGLLIMPASQAAAVLICGWLLGTFSLAADNLSNNPGQHPEAPYHRASTIVLIIFLAATLSLWHFARQEAKNMENYEKQLPSIEWVMPRFWQSGKVCWLHAHPESSKNR